MTPSQKKRIEELQKRISGPRLSDDEFLSCSLELRDNYIIHLVIRSIEQKTYDIGPVSHALEKINYMIDSIRPKGSKEDSPIVIAYELGLPKPSDDKLQA